MKTKLQEDLKDACDNTGGEVRFYNGYAGRGMYGRTCVGISGPVTFCQQVLATVIKDLGWRVSSVVKESDDNKSAEVMDQYESAIDTLVTFSQDNMGYDIIMYWPSLDPIVEEEESEL
jgi:hypothetical protein